MSKRKSMITDSHRGQDSTEWVSSKVFIKNEELVSQHCEIYANITTKIYINWKQNRKPEIENKE